MEQTTQERRYLVRVRESDETGDLLLFTLVPNGLMQARGPGGAPKRVPQFQVEVRQDAGRLVFDWGGSPDDPGSHREEMEAEVAARMNERAKWIDRIKALVDRVEAWAKELGWSTRRVEKKIDDSEIGRPRVPALVMQEDTCRALLEPVGRSTPGTEGVVDLYLMPAYDDIAHLYYDDGLWQLDYVFDTNESRATSREAEAVPLSKEALERALAELRSNAGSR